ncbi:MAG: RsmE family RNA methyltransferase [Candidatus Babeliales bacterium]|nr:RsmE family RNA methyltransferase [Candidatus Babeliales bacterium]
MNNKHEFAIYFPELLKNYELKQIIILTDKDLCHRIINILRMQLNERLILFDRKQNILVEIVAITKKEIKAKVLHKDLNKNLSPKVTILVSILKRESFEDAIYYCVEMGANVIQPIITEKVHFKKWEDKERERLQRIIIAAAEQSKNFNFPELQDPKKLGDYLDEIQNSTNNATKIFFDAQGQNLTEIMGKSKVEQELVLLIGPEGDLTPDEKENLKKAQFQFCKLTPTILRAQTAVGLALGIFRTFKN